MAHAEPHFRRAFAEVFRSRSMLFIGSGLREPYFREMFSEILEIYGPCKQPHYAFVKRDELDPEFMAAHFQIFVLEYDEHSTVPQWLNDLACAVEQKAFRQTPVSFAWRKAEINDSRAPCSRLSVMRGPLPESIGEKECLAVSAGGSGPHFFFSRRIRKLLQRLGINSNSIEDLNLKFVARFEGKPAFAVRAREEGDKRAPRVVGAASTEIFDTAWERGYRRILMQLLAAGAKRMPASNGTRPFSARFCLVESVRAFGAWCRMHPDRELELAIYVLNRSVYLEITSGRLDLNELLSSRDLRFWTNVIYPGGEMRRQMWLAQDSTTIGDLTNWLGLDLRHWTVDAIPSIGPAEKAGVIDLEAISGESLKWHVLPGGTLRFTTLEDIAMRYNLRSSSSAQHPWQTSL